MIFVVLNAFMLLGMGFWRTSLRYRCHYPPIYLIKIHGITYSSSLLCNIFYKPCVISILTCSQVSDMENGNEHKKEESPPILILLVQLAIQLFFNGNSLRPNNVKLFFLLLLTNSPITTSEF